MAYEPGALDVALAAAVGDEPHLIAELRAAFFESATLHIAALREADSQDDWWEAAQRMKGLAASFGARRLMDAANEALAGPRMTIGLRKIEQAVRALSR
jgi:HPt (histidine-containing phosphotransfer) domain-containing protein